MEHSFQSDRRKREIAYSRRIYSSMRVEFITTIQVSQLQLKEPCKMASAILGLYISQHRHTTITVGYLFYLPQRNKPHPILEQRDHSIESSQLRLYLAHQLEIKYILHHPRSEKVVEFAFFETKNCKLRSINVLVARVCLCKQRSQLLPRHSIHL